MWELILLLFGLFVDITVLAFILHHYLTFKRVPCVSVREREDLVREIAILCQAMHRKGDDHSLMCEIRNSVQNVKGMIYDTQGSIRSLGKNMQRTGSPSVMSSGDSPPMMAEDMEGARGSFRRASMSERLVKKLD